MSDDLRRRLEAAGRRPVPGPDQAFADGLETRLLAVAASLPPSGPPPRRSRLRLLLGATLLAGAAVALVIAIGAGADRPIAPPDLEAPVNTEVALVDGTVLEDPDGLRLPEGAVISVGEGGSARVGDTLLRPGDMATVEQGRLRVEHGQPVGSGTSGRATPTPTPTPSRRPSLGATRTPRPTPTPSRTATPDPIHSSPSPTPPRVPATQAPTPVPARTPVPTRSPSPATNLPTATPTASPTIVRPRLRARFVAPDGLRVTWTAVPGASSYVLVATGSEVAPAPRPRYPGGRVVGQFTQVPEAPLRFRVPDGTVEVRLLVAALAPDGTVMSRSRVVTLTTGG